MKKNNDGFVLILFVMILPLIVAILALIVDASNIIINKNKLNNIAEMCLEDTVNVDKILEKNNVNVISYEFYGDDNKRCFKITSKNNTIFARILGYNSYETKSDICKE